MKRFDPRIVFGLLLILGGGLMFLQTLGLLENVGDLFWGFVFLAAGAAFLFVFVTGQWWSVIPGLVLAGIGTIILLPEAFEDWGGAVFLGAIGLSFWAVYLTDRGARWWAIIPGGVLVTLAAVTIVPEFLGGVETGGVFFLGLGLTFLLVAVLTGMRWAYWPAAALGVMGFFLFLPTFLDLTNYFWAAVFILAGGWLLWRYFQSQQ